ncbi:MAG: phage major tail tube protein [Methylotenera sp.]
MAMPRKLKNFNLFADAVSWIGLVPEVVLPKLTRVMEGYRAGGMNGSAKVDLGQGDLEAELSLGGLVKQVFEQYANTKVDGVLLRFAGAYQEDATSSVSAVEVVMRGRYEEIDMGNAKVAENADMKVKIPLTYYKLTIDGTEMIEIDVVNFIERVNGVDMLAKQRQAMGIN